ncbi:MAG: hypothetical protein RR614_04540 [Eubacterium sp.]
MKKKCVVLIISLIFLLSTGLSVSAAEIFIFKGQSEKFVTDITGDTDGFTEMLPGETRTVNLSLKNEDSSEIKFYMSAEILDNIASKTADSQAVYTFIISKNGTPFFSTIIGGGTTKNSSVGDQYLDESNNILLDTLSQGQSDQISITLELDGNSTGNSYMKKTGEIQLVFTASTPDSPIQGGGVVQQIIKRITNNGRSPGTGLMGSNRQLYLILAGAGVVIIAVILMIIKKKKED